ncbi:hypothetical protein MLD38_010459 [Melastoma candidum]|uniref:Uncharacterized protein n=1 Tax=Melastoma candidum TaxID=119954 RepID=A0ACB9QZW3_9MYRT|nr:hypothetical protein MLD38_010459 [Melastoma candidum]
MREMSELYAKLPMVENFTSGTLPMGRHWISEQHHREETRLKFHQVPSVEEQSMLRHHPFKVMRGWLKDIVSTNMAAPPGSFLECHHTSAGKPTVLVIGQPSVLHVCPEPLTSKFNLVKAYESPLPLPSFLAASAHDPASFRALFTSGVTSVSASSILDHLPSLRIIVTTSIGLDHIDLKECGRRGISVANAGDIFPDDVADTAVALTIDVLRRVSAADRFVRKGAWASRVEYPLGSKVSGKRVGIIGLGSIGLRVARRMEGFGCPISYNSRNKKPSVPYAFYSGVHELASNVDILVICCALNEETRHLIDSSVMLALGKDGVVINIARGAIINEEELVGCLVQGDIAGAGLDVFEDEPNVPKELFSLDNVVLSPHAAVFTKESLMELANLMAGNLEAFFEDKPLLTPVNLDEMTR